MHDFIWLLRYSRERAVPNLLISPPVISTALCACQLFTRAANALWCGSPCRRRWLRRWIHNSLPCRGIDRCSATALRGSGARAKRKLRLPAFCQCHRRRQIRKGIRCVGKVAGVHCGTWHKKGRGRELRHGTSAAAPNTRALAPPGGPSAGLEIRHPGAVDVRCNAGVQLFHVTLTSTALFEE